MPEISLKSMTDRQFQKLMDAFKQQTFQILTVVIFIVIILHQKRDIIQDLPVFHTLIQHQFIGTHLLRSFQ